MGHDDVVSGHTISIGFSWVDGWSTNPRIFGRHTRTLSGL